MNSRRLLGAAILFLLAGFVTKNKPVIVFGFLLLGTAAVYRRKGSGTPDED